MSTNIIKTKGKKQIYKNIPIKPNMLMKFDITWQCKKKDHKFNDLFVRSQLFRHICKECIVN